MELARVQERLIKLRMRSVAQRLDALLSEAARTEPTCLDFLDRVVAEETDAKQRKRVSMAAGSARWEKSRIVRRRKHHCENNEL